MFSMHNVSVESAMVNTVVTLSSIRKRSTLLQNAKKKHTSPGVVISFHFSVVLSILNGALRVNLFDIQTTASNFDMDLSMNTNEKEGWHIRDTKFVTSSPSKKRILKVCVA